MSRWWGGRWGLVLAAIAALWWSVVRVPAALAFPHRAKLGATTVLSEQPIGPALKRVLARADRLTAASPLDRPGLTRTVVLTDGGWRWSLLAFTSRGAFGVRRPFSDALILNRSSAEADRVWNGAAVAGSRTLSGVIAHETVHLLVARHLGELRAATLPTWISEGYADHVARESTLSDAEALRLRQAGRTTPAMTYYDARRRVAAALAADGGSVERLLQ